MLYCYAIGERSSRRIERRYVEDVATRVITANRRLITARSRGFASATRGARWPVREVLALCAEAGLVQGGVIAIDGTTVHANASQHANRDYEQIAKEIVAEASCASASSTAICTRSSARARTSASPLNGVNEHRRSSHDQERSFGSGASEPLSWSNMQGRRTRPHGVPAAVSMEFRVICMTAPRSRYTSATRTTRRSDRPRPESTASMQADISGSRSEVTAPDELQASAGARSEPAPLLHPWKRSSGVLTARIHEMRASPRLTLALLPRTTRESVRAA